MKLIIVLLVVTYFATISSGRKIEFGPPRRNYDIQSKVPPLIRKARDLGNSFDESITPYQISNDNLGFELQNSEFEDESFNRPARDINSNFDGIFTPYQISNDDSDLHWQNSEHDDDSSIRHGRDVNFDEVISPYQIYNDEIGYGSEFDDDLLNRPARDVGSNFDETISPYKISNDDAAFDWQYSEHDDYAPIRNARDVSSNFDETISPYQISNVDAAFDWQNTENDDYAPIRNARDVSSNFDETISLNDQDLDWVNNEDAYAVNHIRERRQLIGNVETNSDKTVNAMIGAEGKLLDRDGHTLTGRGTVSKQFNPNQPPVMSGVLDYAGPRAGASVGVDHARNMGTSLNTQGNYNFYTSPNRRTTLDGNAYYQQQFQPRSRPDFGGGVTLRHRF